MGKIYLQLLDRKAYCCKMCGAHQSCTEDLVSKQFYSRSGPAYLFNTAVNVTLGPQEERMMTTGLHTVRDAHCTRCAALLGWRYEAAAERSQAYKQGKYILERSKVVLRNVSGGGQDGLSTRRSAADAAAGYSSTSEEEDVDFEGGRVDQDANKEEVSGRTGQQARGEH